MKDTSAFSDEQLTELLKVLSLKGSKSSLESITTEQVSAIIHLLHPGEEENWREKIAQFYLYLEDRKLLESAGKALTPLQGLVLIDIADEEDLKHQWKLAPLLVGMTHNTFIKILLQCNKEQFHILQIEALTEALQHHLTLLGHDLHRQDKEHRVTLEQIKQEILFLKQDTINTANIHGLFERLDSLRDRYEHLLELNNRALKLAWNTGRPDLIDALTTAKESFTKELYKEIGYSRHEHKTATGIYALFESHLNTVYGNAEDPSDIEALRDDEPALEALTKFSIWYLIDYWHLGLLPSVSQERQLRLDPASHSEKECLEYRERLMRNVQKSLAQLELQTVADFKAAQIYSKQMLEDYIKDRSYQLSNF